MARKPIPGSDAGRWGDILNKYLDVAHAVDGSLKNDSITETKLAPTVRAKINSSAGGVEDGGVTTAKLADGAVTESKVADGTISNAKLAVDANIAQSKIAGLQSALDGKANSNTTVNLSGNQTVSGVKTFSSSPVVPNPSNDNQVTNKAYVDSVAGGGSFALTVGTASAVEYGAGFSSRDDGYMAPANQWVICDTSTGGMGVTLPTPVAGAWVKVKKLTDDPNGVNVWPPSGQISAGSMTSNTIAVNNYGQSEDFWADGSQWHMA